MTNKTKRTGHPATRPDDKRLTPRPGDGRGGKRKPEDEKRILVPFSCNQEFLSRLDAAADAAGLTRSAFLRHCVEFRILVFEKSQEASRNV